MLEERTRKEDHIDFNATVSVIDYHIANMDHKYLSLSARSFKINKDESLTIPGYDEIIPQVNVISFQIDIHRIPA